MSEGNLRARGGIKKKDSPKEEQDHEPTSSTYQINNISGEELLTPARLKRIKLFAIVFIAFNGLEIVALIIKQNIHLFE
jgi:hypothetical protein